MIFQAKVLKQLKAEQPLLCGFSPIVDPRMLEDINQWNELEFEHADWLPALVPLGEWEQYEATNGFLEGRVLQGPYIPLDWSTTVKLFKKIGNHSNWLVHT